jgi:hypothetical protein
MAINQAAIFLVRGLLRVRGHAVAQQSLDDPGPAFAPRTPSASPLLRDGRLRAEDLGVAWWDRPSGGLTPALPAA